MPFENTHLYLADKVRQALQNDELSTILKAHLDYYYLGSIFPDILFISKDQSISQLAYRLHGDGGVPTNQFVFGVLDRIRESRSLRDFAFIAGFLTHCAADITFHPIVFYISGYRPNAGKKEKQHYSYLHWKYETLIDARLNDRFRVEECVHPNLVKDLVAPEVLGVDVDTIIKHFERHRGYFAKIGSRFYYHVFRILSRLGLVPPEAEAGFYESLKAGDITLPERIPYRDVLSGEEMETSLDELADQSVNLGCRLVAAAHDYFTGTISREMCEETIVGESLHTGRLGKTMQDISHSASIPNI